MPIHPYRRHRLFTLLDEEEEEDKKKQYRLVLRSAAFIPLRRRQQARSWSHNRLKTRTSTVFAIVLAAIIFFSYSAFAFTLAKSPETVSVSTLAPAPSTSATILPTTVPPTPLTPTPLPSPRHTPTPIATPTSAPAPAPSTSATIPPTTVPPTTVPPTTVPPTTVPPTTVPPTTVPPTTVPPTTVPPPVQRTLASQQTQSQTVNATGTGQTPAKSAAGTLTFTNQYHHEYIYLTGSKYNSSNGVQIAIDSQADVPAGDVDSKISITVFSHAVNLGSIGNIAVGSVNTTTSDGVIVSNNTPFTGGTDPQTYTTVQQSDIDTAANSLQASTTQSAFADIKSKLQSNEHLVDAPQCSSTPTSDHAAGDQANTVTVTVTTTCQATAST